MNFLSAQALVIHQGAKFVMAGISCKNRLVAQTCVPYHLASQELVVCIDRVLQDASFLWKDLSYIACIIGPAPFTTLRTLVVTTNGLGFATGLPLVGINGLDCFVRESHRPYYDRSFAVVNAFGDDVYYAGYSSSSSYELCQTLPLHQAVENIAAYARHQPDARLQIVGNVAVKCHTSLQEKGIAAHVNHEHTCASLEALVNDAYKAWCDGIVSKELVPYYGKATSGA